MQLLTYFPWVAERTSVLAINLRKCQYQMWKTETPAYTWLLR